MSQFHDTNRAQHQQPRQGPLYRSQPLQQQHGVQIHRPVKGAENPAYGGTLSPDTVRG